MDPRVAAVPPWRRGDEEAFQYLANALLYFDATLELLAGHPARYRRRPAVVASRHSGDYPIVLCRIDGADDRDRAPAVARTRKAQQVPPVTLCS
jgi:hypothetical protein